MLKFRLILIGFALAPALGLTLTPGRVSAQDLGVSINEIQLGGEGVGTAGDEFIELYNSSPVAVSIAGWRIEYRSGGSGSDCTIGWSLKSSFNDPTIVAPKAYWLLSSGDHLPTADKTFAPGLSGTAGTLRLVDHTGNVKSKVAWGGAYCGDSAVAPPGGSSLLADSGGWIVSLAPSPVDSSGFTADVVVQIVKLSEAADGVLVELLNNGSTIVDLSEYDLKLGEVIDSLDGIHLDTNESLSIHMDSDMPLLQESGQIELRHSSGAIMDMTSWTAQPAGAIAWSYEPSGWAWVGHIEPLDDAEGTIRLNEILVDPVAPLTDAADEFIELYNDSLTTVDLTGYKLIAGGSTTRTYLIDGFELKPAEFLTVRAQDSRLTLPNSGGKVQLLNPMGVVISEVTYPVALPGYSYSFMDQHWVWTAIATPGNINVLVAPLAKFGQLKATKIKSIKAAKAKAIKKAAVKKKKSPKNPKPKKTPDLLPATIIKEPPTASWLLFILGGLTIGYVAYEFRYDLQNYIFRARRYFGSRGAARPDIETGERPRTD